MQIIEPLDATHGDELIRLMRACPVEAETSFVVDRAPDFFTWPRIAFDQFRYFGIFDDGSLVGQLVTGYRRGWLGNGFGRYLYIGDLRVLPHARGWHLTLAAASRIFAELPPDVSLGCALVAESNAAAVAVLTQAVVAAGLPTNTSRLCIYSISTEAPRQAPPEIVIRRAGRDDAEPVARLLASGAEGRLFAPETHATSWPECWMAESSGRIVGAVRAVDMSGSRRIVPAHGSSKARRAIALISIAAEDDRPDVLSSLLSHLQKEYSAPNTFLRICQPTHFATDSTLRKFPIEETRAHLFVFGRRPDAIASAGPAVNAPYLDMRMM